MEPPIIVDQTAPSRNLDQSATQKPPEKVEDPKSDKIPSVSRNTKVLRYLEEQYNNIVKNSTKNNSIKELEQDLNQIDILKENLKLLIKAIKNLQKVKDLTIRQIFEISNKQVELDDQQVQLSQNLLAPGSSSANHFELHAEQLLMEIQISHPDDSSSDEELLSITTKPPESLNEYHEGYLKSKKLFKKMQKKMEDLRHEQIQYILNTLKILCLFLIMSQKLQLDQKNVLNEHKLVEFLINLDYRMKITVFIAIQRISDDEELNKIAQEAVDMHTISMAIEKNKKHETGEKKSTMEEFYKNKFKKDKAQLEEQRLQFDQYGNQIELVDSFLFNNFTVIELVKLKLDFLAVLHFKKPQMQQNFDIQTNRELLRFEQQMKSNILMDEYVKDLENHALNLNRQGLLIDLTQQDPVKMYFQSSIKALILSNRITGPALCNDINTSNLLENFYSSKVSLEKSLNKVNSLASIRASKDQDKKPEEPLLRPGNTSPSVNELTPVKIELKPEPIVEIPQLDEVQLNICNSVISSDLFVQTISEALFQNNLPFEIKEGLKAGLLSLVGRTPPQFVIENFQKEYEVIFDEPEQQDDKIPTPFSPGQKSTTTYNRVDSQGGEKSAISFITSANFITHPDEDFQEKGYNEVSLVDKNVIGFGEFEEFLIASKKEKFEDNIKIVNQNIGFMQDQVFGSVSGSTSLCTQDLVLLTDFLPLPSVIQLLCKGQQLSKESLLSLDSLEQILTSLGKNEGELRKDPHDYTYLDAPTSSYNYEMNSLKIDQNYLQSMMFSNSLGYLDQDMFALLIITSLFETDSISQVDSPENRGLKIKFNQLLDENDQSLNQILNIAKSYVTGIKPTQARNQIIIDQKSENEGETKTLIYVFNQLMVHQILSKQNYEQQIFQTNIKIKLFHEKVLQIQNMYVLHFLQNFVKPGAIYDFTNLENYVAKFGGNDLTKAQFAQQVKNFLNLDKDLVDIDFDDLISPAIVEHQDYLKNPDIDQELSMATALLELQLDHLNTQKQRFLQKLFNQIEVAHITNEKLLFLKRHLIIKEKGAFMKQIETNTDAPSQSNLDKSGTMRAKKKTMTLDFQSRDESTPDKYEGNKVASKLSSMGGSPMNSIKNTIPDQKLIMEKMETTYSPMLPKKPAAVEHHNTINLEFIDIKPRESESKNLSSKKMTSIIEEKKRMHQEEQLKEQEAARTKFVLDLMNGVIIQNDFMVSEFYERIEKRTLDLQSIKLLNNFLNKIEQLLHTCDLELLKQRLILVQTLKSVENGMDDRENFIKDQLKNIAILEMEKGTEEDKMLDQTLKTIEFVKIADIAQEKENLQQDCDHLSNKMADLERLEEELMKEKSKRDSKKKPDGKLQKQKTMLPGKQVDETNSSIVSPMSLDKK